MVMCCDRKCSNDDREPESVDFAFHTFPIDPKFYYEIALNADCAVCVVQFTLNFCVTCVTVDLYLSILSQRQRTSSKTLRRERRERRKRRERACTSDSDLDTICLYMYTR